MKQRRRDSTSPDRMLRRHDRLAGLLTSAFFIVACLLAAGPAAAHPHVWVIARVTVVYDEAGRLTALRQSWTFDEGYSAFAVQGLETGPDGKPTPAKLAELAAVNLQSLADQLYFTVARTGGGKLAFAAPTDGTLDTDGRQLTLSFTLPLAAAQPAPRSLTIDVYDPSFFVDFSLAADEGAAAMSGAPADCALRVRRPKRPEAAAASTESFFAALSATTDVGLRLSNRITITCGQ
jgi:ABC-type uncharacterized transport system substrate-binding protein